MAAENIASALLQHADHGALPSDEAVVSAQLGSETLLGLVHHLNSARNGAQEEIRRLSKDTAPDIDTWIARAKEVQADIERSRETARQIVAEHEAGRELQAKAEDTRKKVHLLEGEVAFEEALASTLERIQRTNGLLDAAQDEAVKANVKDALNLLGQAESSIAELSALQDTKAYSLIQQRAKQLRDSCCEMATDIWNALIQIDTENKTIRVLGQGSSLFPDAAAPEMNLPLIMVGVKELGLFDSLIQKLSKDVDRTIIKPRLTVDDEQQVPNVYVTEETLTCTNWHDDVSFAAVLEDLETIVGFLSTRLPPEIAVPLSDHLMPSLTVHLEEKWLEPAVPLDVEDMPEFQQFLIGTEQFAGYVDEQGWHQSKLLREWVQNAPRTWLTKRREAVLGDVRNLVFTGLRETKVVERVETQMVSKEDSHAFGGGNGESGDDDWDEAWDETDEAPPTATESQPNAPAEEEDDGSAWETEEADKYAPKDGDEGDDAWDAWDDNEEEQTTAGEPQTAAAKATATSAPKLNGNAPPKQAERQVTLRETFTITSIPDILLTILKNTITDAQTLAGPAFAASPIAPAATALYTLPTLALAIYRATAPTAYSKLPTGNLLIYNDATHLASSLRDWQASQPPASRLRLDADVKNLETFAKRAYSSEMDSQRTILRDLLDGAQGFSNCTKAPFKQEYESAVEQTVDRLRTVHQQWKGVLSDGALLQSLGSLLATVTGKMISEIEDLGDIGEEDSHQLRKLMDVVSSAKDIFTQQRQDGAAEPADMTFIYCPNWLKFQYLAEILDSSLADIKYLWTEGELSLEFEAGEVVELIEGLFAESDVRRRTIAEIRRGGGRR